MDTKKDCSIKATVYICFYGYVRKEVIEDGLSYDTTIEELKSKFCSIATDIGHELVVPDEAKLFWNLGKLEDYMTLGSLPSSPNLCSMNLVPDIARVQWKQDGDEELRWIETCTQVREELEARQDEGVRSLSTEKRPKINGSLPYAQFGGLMFDGGRLTRIVAGSKFPLVSNKIETLAPSFTTGASVVLLVPNIRIFNTVLSSLPSHSKSKYLVIHVSWDVLSYVFLRQLRIDYPNLPFVAVTDLDPHQLDLFTFLDTCPESISDCYGWDLGLEIDDEETSFIYDQEFVEIAWLGLRPSQLRELDHFDDQNHSSDPAADFCNVIRMIEVNPYFRSKETWLKELERFECHGKIEVLKPTDNEFISKKLSEEDWI